jgi:hypothetical protein
VLVLSRQDVERLLDLDALVEAVAAAMAEANVAKFVTGEIRRVIFVPGRMLNLLVGA